MGILAALLMLLTIFTSCKPEIGPQMLCTYLHDYQACHCICVAPFELKKVEDKECGTFQSGNYPAGMCNKVSGFKIEDIATKIKPKIKELNRYIDDLEAEAGQCRIDLNPFLNR